MIDWTAYNVDLFHSTIAELCSVYKTQVTTVSTFRTSQAQRNPNTEARNKAIDTVLNTVPQKPIQAQLEDISNSIFDLIDEDESSVGAVVAWSKRLTSMLNNEVSHYASELMEEETSNVLSTEQIEAYKEAVVARQVAEELKTVIEMRIKVSKTTGDVLPDNLYKQGERTRFNSEIIPNLPSELEEEDLTDNSIYKRMEYVVTLNDGTEHIFAKGSTTLPKIARLLTVGTFRPTLKSLEKEMLEQNPSLKTQATLDNGEWWSFKTKTGTIKGRKVK